MSDPSSYPQDQEGPFGADWDGLAEESGEEGANATPDDSAARAADEEERIDPLASARRGRYDESRELEEE